MSDTYQLWNGEAPRHRDLTFVLFHRHNEGGTCSLHSIFKDVGTAMTLSEGYYTNQRVLRDICHVYHRLHLVCMMFARRQPKEAVIGKKINKIYQPKPQVILWGFVIQLGKAMKFGAYLSNSTYSLSKKYYILKYYTLKTVLWDSFK